MHNDSHVCGIVAKVMTHMEQFNYLASPSIYNKLIRFIVISWFVEGKTDYGVLQIDYVYESDCDIVTNNDDEKVTFVDFPLTYKKETTKCNENVKGNMKKCCHCSF